MLESKLKRRYTWPVELLGVIVEDGEVIIGTEDQIFPNGQINSDFINLQHQQNLHAQHHPCTVQTSNTSQSGRVSGTSNNLRLDLVNDCLQVDLLSNKDECNSSDEDNDEEGMNQGFHVEQGSSSNIRLLKHANCGSNTEKAKIPLSSSERGEYDVFGDDRSGIGKHNILSPTIINIDGSHDTNQVQVEHGSCTCAQSTNKHNNGQAKEKNCLTNCGPAKGEQIFTSGLGYEKKSTSYNGTCFNYDPNDQEENSSNEVLQVSSLYPVTEEDALTHTHTASTGEIKESSIKRRSGKCNVV